ncbi:MAG: hypothetical protein R6V83_14180 [Candidatus Thorarchaeota archaeon]
MNIEIHINRVHYDATIELSDEEISNVENLIDERLEAIEQVLKKSSSVWHQPISKNLDHLVSILPNGSARFSPEIESRLDQIIIAMHLAGRKGIRNQEIAELLGVTVSTITAHYGNENYRDLFEEIEKSRHRLAGPGLERLQNILLTDEREEDTIEGED